MDKNVCQMNERAALYQSAPKHSFGYWLLVATLSVILWMILVIPTFIIMNVKLVKYLLSLETMKNPDDMIRIIKNGY